MVKEVLRVFSQVTNQRLRECPAKHNKTWGENKCKPAILKLGLP